MLLKLVDAFETAEGLVASELRRLNHQDPDLKREVKIAGPASIISHVLIPACPDIMRDHPQVVPVFERRLNAEGLGLHDVVIAFQPPGAGRFKIRRCAKFDYALYAPEGWEKGDGWITLIDKFAADHTADAERFFGRAPSLKTDSFDQAIRAMHRLNLAGALPLAVAQNAPGLKRLEARNLEVSRDLFVIHHESRSSDPDIRATVNWVMQCLEGMTDSNPASAKDG